jgi:hypothetical protein
VERALRIEPDNAWIWHLLARIHHHQIDYEMAHNMAEKSSSLAGNDAALKARNTWLITVADQASKRLETGTGEGVRKKGPLAQPRDGVVALNEHWDPSARKGAVLALHW